MSTETITTVLKIQDQFSQPLQRLDSALHRSVGAAKDFSQATSSMGSGLKQGAADMFHMINAAQQYYQVMSGVFRTANEWAQQGIAAERNKIALQSLTGAGREYQDQIHGIIDATRGLVTAGEAAGYAYRLQRFGLADTAAEMEKFMRTVSIVAAVNPQLGGTAEAINQIQLTLSNMSFMRLDQLGVSAGKVRERMAELKAATKDMSDEQAFSAAVMEQLNEQADAVGDSILDMNDAGERMQTRWRGFKEDWGLKIAEGFEAIAESAEGVAAAIDKVGAGRTVLELLSQTIGTPTNLSGWGGTSTPQGPYDWTQASPEMQAMITAAEAAYKDRQAQDQLLQAQVGALLLFYQMNPFNTTPTIRTTTTAATFTPTQQDISNPNFGYSVPAWMQAPPMDYQAYYARQNRMRYEPSSYTSPGSEYGPMLGSFMAGGPPGPQAITYGGGAVGEKVDFAAAESNLKSAAGYSAEIERNLANAAQEWDSLNEKFGVSATSFDTDVFSSMTGAMNTIGIEGEAAAQAIQAYQLATGMATGSSELFEAKLTNLTEKFDTGKLSVDAYVQGVLDLGQEDLSGMDAIIQRMVDTGKSIDDINAAIGRVAELPQNLTTLLYGGAPTMPTGVSPASGATPGEAVEKPQYMGNALDILNAKYDDAAAAAEDFSSRTRQGLIDVESGVVSMASTMEKNLDALDGRQIHISAVVDIQTYINDAMGLYEPTGAPLGTSLSALGDPVGGRAGGGDVRGGGLYRVTEGQIPELFEGPGGQQYLMAPRGGGRVIAPQFAASSAGGGEAQIVIPLYIDKEKVGEAVAEVSRTRGAKTR